jgi:hypothetical protein
MATITTSRATQKQTQVKEQTKEQEEQLIRLFFGSYINCKTFCK